MLPKGKSSSDPKKTSASPIVRAPTVLPRGTSSSDPRRIQTTPVVHSHKEEYKRASGPSAQQTLATKGAVRHMAAGMAFGLGSGAA